MFPTHDTAHAAEGAALFTDHYRGKKVVGGLTQAYLNQIQKLEDAIWGVINGFLLATPPVGQQLDFIGELVGQPRGNLSDAAYLLAIRVRIRVNRSQGTSEDVIQVASLFEGVSVAYLDVYPASFLVEILNDANALVLADLLSETRSAGTYGVLDYTTWATGNDFMWGSVTSASAGQGTWGSVTSPSTGGLLAAGAAL